MLKVHVSLGPRPSSLNRFGIRQPSLGGRCRGTRRMSRTLYHKTKRDNVHALRIMKSNPFHSPHIFICGSAVPRRVILSASRNFATMRFRHLWCRPYGFDRLRMTHCRKIAIGGISSEQRLTPSVSVYKCVPKAHVSLGHRPSSLNCFRYPSAFPSREGAEVRGG